MKLTFRPLYSAEVKMEGEPFDGPPPLIPTPRDGNSVRCGQGRIYLVAARWCFLTSSATRKRGAGSELQGDDALAQHLFFDIR